MEPEKKDYGQMILPDGKYYSLDDRETGINNNIILCGSSGSGKTSCFMTPNLVEAVGSYVITDPKGVLFKKWSKYLREQGYKITRISFIHPEMSHHYNPLHYCKTTQQIQQLSHILVRSAGLYRSDPFWDVMSQILLNSIIGYLKETQPESKRNIGNMLRLLRCAVRKDEDSGSKESQLAYLMRELKHKNPNSWAVSQFEEVNLSAGKTFASIAVTASSKLSAYDTDELAKMLKYDTVNIKSIAKKKSVVFIEVSDSDRSMDSLVNIFFSQCMHELCTFADEECQNSELPVPVRFFMDDFATGCLLDNLDREISNVRARKISVVMAIQSLAQLTAGYGEAAHTIIDNSDTFIYMGGNDPKTAEDVAVRVNKRTNTILHMPIRTSWIMRRGEEPFLCDNMDPDKYLMDKGISPDTSYDIDDQETNKIL